MSCTLSARNLSKQTRLSRLGVTPWRLEFSSGYLRRVRLIKIADPQWLVAKYGLAEKRVVLHGPESALAVVTAAKHVHPSANSGGPHRTRDTPSPSAGRLI
jgi:hypothetical protein